MAKRNTAEADLTTVLIDSLARAGVVDPWKIPDPVKGTGVDKRTGRTFTFVRGSERPCDIIGTLDGGRSLRIEAKQSQLLASGNVPAFNYSRLSPHQHLHLNKVMVVGGCAVVALFVWRKQARGRKWVKRLLWMPYGPLMREWAKYGDSIPGPVMGAKRAVPVRMAGRKFDGWDLSAEIRAASRVQRILDHPIETVADLLL